MLFAALVFTSLILQCIAVFYSFRLISITGHTKAWLLLSLSIASMAVRRLITLAASFPDPGPHSLTAYTYEIFGILGSALMVAGVLLIKPVFLLIKSSEEKQRTLAEHLQSALDSVRILKELLPICANCKKIRDDDGYWQQIETYISKNSATKFSHGICPSCCKELYPDQYEKMFSEEMGVELLKHDKRIFHS